MKKLSSILSENLANSSMTLTNLTSFDELLKKASEINEPKTDGIVSVFIQQHNKGLSDEMLQSYFTIADIVGAFIEVSKYYKENRKKLSWLDEKIIKELNSIQKYVNQLASYISVEHENIKTQISLSPDLFENNKTIATFIKQSDEWKDLKKLLKNDLVLSNQSLTIRCLGVSIVQKTKAFVKIIT